MFSLKNMKLKKVISKFSDASNLPFRVSLGISKFPLSIAFDPNKLIELIKSRKLIRTMSGLNTLTLSTFGNTIDINRKLGKLVDIELNE